MAIRTGRWVAAAAFVVAAVACLLAFNKVLGAGSPWCDGATVLPSVICGLHPTRWVSKGYPPGLFGSRKSRAGGPLPTQLPPELDAAADFGETAGGVQTHPAGGTGGAEEAAADSLSNAAPANEAAGTAQTAPGQPHKAEVDSQPQQPQPGAPDEQTAERSQEQASEQLAATPAGSASQAEQQRFEEQQKEQLQPDAALAEQQPTEQQAVAADDRQPEAQPEESTGADTDAEPAGQQANEGAPAEQQPAEGTQPDADAQQADEGTSAEQQPPQGTQPDADAQHDPQSQQLPAQTAASAAAGAESAGLEAAAPAEQQQAEGAQPDPTAQQQPDGGSGKPAEDQQPDGQADGTSGESAEQQTQQPEIGETVHEQQPAETRAERPEVGDAAGERPEVGDAAGERPEVGDAAGERPEVGDAAGERPAAEAPPQGRLPPVREWVDEQEVIWEKPRGEARGIFLALNGCNHGADGWWDAQPACKDCLGLPEEKAIVKAAIDRGHVTIALSVVQQRTKMRCWANLTPPNVNTDMKSTLKTVKLLVGREGWQGLPLYAWGGSAGGTFAARLPYYLRMEGIMVQLKSVKGEELDANPQDPATGEAWPYPKVVYAYNRRDPVAQQRATHYTGALKAKGVHYALLAADPTPLTPDFFTRRVEEINATVSAQLYDALKISGLLDEHGYLPRDPRKSDKRWQAVLREQVPYANTVRLEKYVSSIFEELNWAYSNHQGISDCTAASFEFFESGKQPDEKMLENPGFWALQGQQPPDGSPP